MWLLSTFVFRLAADFAIGQPPVPPPPPPPPPRFMTMKGLPLSCFDTPAFTDDGLEFFVCNGGGGIAGVRKQIDPKRTIWVRDLDIEHNLNMQAAKIACGNKPLVTSAAADGTVSFDCKGKEIPHEERFRTASKAEWKKYDGYLNK
jgi:hypothetical protein